MSDPIVTGIRLLRAVFEAQRELDSWHGRTGRRADEEWCKADEALQSAKAALAEFETRTDEDFKLKQAGDRS